MITYLSTELAIGVLFVLLACSAFFSGSETGMMSLNRYRMRHLALTRSRARRILKMLKRPDRLLGVILIGNTFANILASSIATLLAITLFGEKLGVPIATIGLTLLLLIFAEVLPKTLAALYPERFAFTVVYPLSVIAMILSPLVLVVNTVSNTFLRMFGIRLDKANSHALSREELKTIVHESAGRHRLPRSMLLSVLDLETVTVNDIMVPKSEILAIDLSDPWERILDQLAHTQHTMLPVFQEDINDVLGVFHARHALNSLVESELSLEKISEQLTKPYFIPEGTPLNVQLLEFRQRKERLGLVVDEYGEILGLITLADILEEIVGEFTTDMATLSRDVHPQEDGSFLFDGSITIRELNRAMGWKWPQDGPKTLSGLIIAQLECIPETGTCLLLEGLPTEVVLVKDNVIKTVRINPALYPDYAENEDNTP